MDKPERATGGPIKAGGVPIIGEDGCSLSLPTSCDCGCRGECVTPTNITINVHGTVASETNLADVIRKQVLQFNRRNNNGPAPA